MKKLLVLLFSISITCSGFAQASLVAQDMMDDIVVTTANNELKTYTVVRDYRNKDQWYYVPSTVRLAEKKSVGGLVEPKITIIRYQYQDKVTKVNKEGGNLTFVFTMAMEPEAVNQIKQTLITRTKNPNSRVAPLPISSCKITMLSANGDFTDFDAAPTTGSTFINQEIAFSVPLTVLGTDVFSALVKSTTGIAMRIDARYSGLLPPCGFTATGNWDNVYSYFEKNQRYEAGIGFLGFSLGAKMQKQEIKDSLSTKLGLKVDEYGCGGKGDSMNSYMQEIIKKIQEEVFTRSAIDSSKKFEQLKSMLSDPNISDAVKQSIAKMANPWEVKLGAQHSVKQISKRKTGEINITFNKHQLVERDLRVDGTLGLSSYNLSENDLKKYIIDVQAGNWASALFGLPTAVNPDLEILSMGIQIGYKLPNGSQLQDARQWTPDSGWTTTGQIKNSAIVFNLLGVTKDTPIDDLEFKATLNITTKNGSFAVNKNIKAFNGETNFDAIEQMVRLVSIDLTSLDYTKLTGTNTDLDHVEIKLKHGSRTISKSIKPYLVNGTVGPPNMLNILLNEDGGPAKLEVVFVKSDGTKINKVIEDVSGDVTFGNYDWKQL